MENLSVALEANINQFQQNLATAAKAVQDFGAKTSRVGDTQIKLSTDTAGLSKALAVLAEAERAIKGFAASSKGIKDVSFDVTADTSTLTGLEAKLKQAAATLQAFRQQAQQADDTQVNLLVTGTDFTRLEANIDKATASVREFARQSERVKAASLEVRADTSGIDTLRSQLTEATRAIDAFAQKAQQDTGVRIRVEADAASINNLKGTLDEALTAVQRFAAQSANNIGIDVTVNADSNILPQLQAELNTALAAVKSFSIDASSVAGVKVDTDTASLNALQASLADAADAIQSLGAVARSTGEVEVRVKADTAALEGLRTKLTTASEQIRAFAEKATTTAEVDLRVNAASIDISSLKGKIDEAIGQINRLSGAQANRVDITLDAEVTGLPKVQAQLLQASQAVQDFADKANAGAKVDLKVEADTADVAQLKDVLGTASAALKDFTANAAGAAAVDLNVAADTAALDGLKTDLREAAGAITAFSALASGTTGIKVNTDTSELSYLQAQLKQSEAAFKSFQAKAQAAGKIDLSINVSGAGLDSIQQKLDAAAQAVRDFAAKANTTADIDLSVSTDLNQLKAQINEAAQAVSDFAAKSGIVGDVKIKVQVDDASLLKTSADVAAFAAKTDGIEDIHLKVTTDAGSLDTVREGLNAATKEANAFTAGLARANGTSLNLSDDTQQAERFTDEMLRATGAVQGYSRKVTEIPAPKLQAVKPPPINVDTAEVERALDALGNRLRIAQANAELFGDQFQSDKLKLVAYQQALNQLVSAGLKPTSKEVLKVADNIEKLADELQEAERQTKRLDMFASFKATGKIIPDLEAKAKRLQTAMRDAMDPKDVERYQKRLAAVNQQLAQFGTRGTGGIKNVNNGMNNLSGSANQVGLEFARLVQDAPYAANSFGAIANNVQQLTANFGQLRQQSGSTSAALKASLAASFTGVGAITLGISALTAGLTAYQMWSQSAARATKEGADAMKDAEQAADEYIKTLNDINQARLKGDRDAQKELTTLRLLYNRTQDATISIQERGKAVDELQKQYPAYFKNLKDEDILAGKAAGAYDRLSTSLINTARARAAQESMTNKARQILVLESQAADYLVKKNEKLAQAQKSLNQIRAGGTGTGAAGLASMAEKAEEAAASFGNLRKTALEDIKRLQKEMESLVPQASLGLISDDEVKETKEKTDKVAEAWKKLIEGFNNSTRLFKELGNEYDVFSAKADMLNSTFEELTSLGVNPQSKAMQKLIEQWREFREAAKMPELKSIESEVRFKPIVDAKDFRKIDFDVFSGLVDDNRVARESLLALGKTFGTLDYQIGMASAELRNYETALNDSIAQGLSASSPRVVEFSEKIAMLREELIKLDMQKGVFPSMGDAIDTFMKRASTSAERLAAMGAVISDFAITAFSSIGKGLGDMFQGLASGVDVIKNIGADILDALSEYLADFGKKLFLAGLGETLLGLPTGPVKMATGGLLIAAAGLGSSLSGGLRSGGGGGSSPNVATSISGTGGYKGALDQQGPDELVARVTGDQLEFILSRRDYKNKRFGSG